MSSLSKLTIAAALVLLAATKAGAAELPFATQTATAAPVVRTSNFDGIVEAVNQSTVSAQISGRIMEVRFDVDDVVEQGQIIIRFDDTRQRASLRRAEAALSEARARVSELATEFDRARKLLAQGTIPKARFDAVKADFDAARSRLDAARADRVQAGEQLAYTQVRAPYGGVVTKRHVEIGEVASAGQALMTGFSLDTLRVRVDVPQQYAETLRRGARAAIVFGGRRLKPGALTIFPYASASSSTFRVRASLTEKPDGLYPGMLVKVSFETGRQEQVTIAREAVAYRGELVAVYVVGENGAVSLRQIRPGRELPDGRIAVLAGLKAGETVALDPVAAGIYLKTAANGRP